MRTRTTDSFNEGDHDTFRDTLSDSAFTLCPGGTNEETFRVYEALEAGSIPIIKANQAAFAAFNEPLPPFDGTGGLHRARSHHHHHHQSKQAKQSKLKEEEKEKGGEEQDSQSGPSDVEQQHPLPTVASWDLAPQLLQHLSAQPLEEIDALQQRTREWWETFKQAHAAAFGEAIREQRRRRRRGSSSSSSSSSSTTTPARRNQPQPR